MSEAGAGFRCRSCSASGCELLLELGETPLANALLERTALGQPEPRYPLALVFCPRCSLVQIDYTVPPAQLFTHYLYFSSFSDELVEHARQNVRRLVERRRLTQDSFVVEIASNDGYLLQHYRSFGVPVLGIEPARNAARVAVEQRGVPTLDAFFDRAVAVALRERGRGAQVIHANNVLAHVADLNDFVAGLRELLAEDGVVVIEVPYLKDLIDQCQFDTIYHEHLCYFTQTALEQLFERHQLALIDLEHLSIHGGSLRLFVARAAAAEPSPAVRRGRESEEHWGAARRGFYQDFATRVCSLKVALVALLRELKARGKTVAAYGAAAKGSTLLNYAGIGPETIDFVVDRNVHKQGRYMPGVHLPIYDPARLLVEQPDYLLLLSWNFAGEIMAQQAAYHAAGGRFIVPIPEPRIVGSPAETSP